MLYLAVYDTSVPGMGRTLRGKEMIKYFSNRYELHLIDFKETPKFRSLVEQSYYSGNQIQKDQVPFSRLGHFVFSPSFLRQTEAIMKCVKFDVIVADYGTAAIYGYLMSKKWKTPWVYCSHQIEYRRFLDFGRTDFKRFLFVPFLYFVERMGCKADLVCAISEPDAKIFSRWVKTDKMIVVPQGFDETSYHPFYKMPSKDPQTVLFVGNYDYMPNREAVDIIYRRILPRVIEEFPKAVFQFVGPNPPKELNHPNILFTGYVNDISNYLQEASVVIVPVLHAAGMRTKIIESLACGKRVISTDIAATGIPEYYRNLIIRDIDHFPKAICEAIKIGGTVDGTDYNALLEEFSWQRILERLDNKIKEIMDHH
jgi:glycosyltransferase involved in cell wall biosynthesis